MLAAAGVGLTGLGLSCLKGRSDVGVMFNGTLAGLVAITACAPLVEPWSSVVIGALGASIALTATILLERIQLDDVVGAVPVHACAGAWGTISVALFGDSTLWKSGLSRWG